jgi:hypothetical protein
MPRKPKPAPTEVFISHSSKNADFISRLNGVLTDHKVKSFVSKANIRGAQQWHDEIGTALKRCDWFLLVASAVPPVCAFEVGQKRIDLRLAGEPL